MDSHIWPGYGIVNVKLTLFKHRTPQHYPTALQTNLRNLHGLSIHIILPLPCHAPIQQILETGVPEHRPHLHLHPHCRQLHPVHSGGHGTQQHQSMGYTHIAVGVHTVWVGQQHPTGQLESERGGTYFVAGDGMDDCVYLAGHGAEDDGGWAVFHGVGWNELNSWGGVF